MSKWRPSRPPLALVMAVLVAAGAGGIYYFDAIGATTTFFAPEPAPSRVPAAAAAAPAEPSPAPVADQVAVVPPALRATIPEGVSPDVLSTARSVPGVGAAAAVLLSNLVVEIPDGGGEAQVSIAAVEPDEFRPLAPEASAHAGFVWEGLKRAETFIAHEQFQILGGKPLKSLAARGPNGKKDIRIAGLAASGVPNLAGAMMSLQEAGALGLGNPTMLVLGLHEDASYSAVLTTLGKVLPGVRFEETRPRGSLSFFTGADAARAIGAFRYSPNADGSIRQDGGWVARNIVSQEVPILGRIKCHKVIFRQLEAALTEIQNAGLAATIKPGQFGGCYVPRFIERDGSRPLSMHAWGLALDINVADNPKGERPNQDLRMVEILEKWGFRWGGRWSPPDAHHFELGALLKEG